MRHAVFGKRLGRNTNSRKALLNNLANDLFYRGRVTTTLAKAKFARNYVEKLITSAKFNRLERNRHIASLISDRAFTKLTQEIGPGFSSRQGGYTRIVKLNRRLGDAALLARLELLEYEKKALPKAAKRKAANIVQTAVLKTETSNEKPNKKQGTIKTGSKKNKKQ